MAHQFTNGEIISQFTSNNVDDCKKKGTGYIFQVLGVDLTAVEDGFVKLLEKKVSRLRTAQNERWNAASRNQSRYQQVNSDWLNAKFEVPTVVMKESPSSSHGGRPLVPIPQLSDESRRKLAYHLSDEAQQHTSTLVSAAAHSARKANEKDLVFLLTEAMRSPKRPYKIRRAYQKQARPFEKLSMDEALAMILDLNFTKHQYTQVHQISKAHGANIYPNYTYVAKAKLKLRPNSGITISETTSEVELQPLLNHTAARILQLQNDEILEYAKGH